MTGSPYCISINTRIWYYFFLHRWLVPDKTFNLYKSTVCWKNRWINYFIMYKKFINVVILFLISLDIVVRRLLNVLLFGVILEILESPHAFLIFLLYGRSIAIYSCNDLLESNLNQIRTIKHLKITLWEYTYGLPRFFFLPSFFDQDYRTNQIQNTN